MNNVSPDEVRTPAKKKAAVQFILEVAVLLCIAIPLTALACNGGGNGNGQGKQKAAAAAGACACACACANKKKSSKPVQNFINIDGGVPFNLKDPNIIKVQLFNPQGQRLRLNTLIQRVQQGPVKRLAVIAKIITSDPSIVLNRTSATFFLGQNNQPRVIVRHKDPVNGSQVRIFTRPILS